MIAKAGIAAVVVITALVSGRSVDLRALYDQMYPVSTLRRDALNLCHESDPTFIRAVREDRETCYTSMPYAIALALGLVHPDSALAGLFSPLGRVLGTRELGDAALGSWAASTRQPPLTSRLAIGDRATAPCSDKASALAEMPAGQINTATALNALAGHRGIAGDNPLTRLGLSTHDPAPSPGLASPSTAQSNPGDGLTLLDTTAADLGDMPAAPAAPAIACSAKI